MLLFYVFFIIGALLIMNYDVFYVYGQWYLIINLNLIIVVVFITCFPGDHRRCFGKVRLIGLWGLFRDRCKHHQLFLSIIKQYCTLTA